jgi:hypothetical protein
MARCFVYEKMCSLGMASQTFRAVTDIINIVFVVYNIFGGEVCRFLLYTIPTGYYSGQVASLSGFVLFCISDFTVFENIV